MSLRYYFYLDREQLSVLLSTSELTLCERRNRWVPVVVHEAGSVGLKFLPIVFCGPTAAEYIRIGDIVRAYTGKVSLFLVLPDRTLELNVYITKRKKATTQAIRNLINH